MRISDIPRADRPAIGRAIYEARLEPMPWREAVMLALGLDGIGEVEASAIAQTLARDHALSSGKPWPADCPLSRDRMKQARAAARAKPVRDWLILTDGPARFASELPAPA